MSIFIRPSRWLRVRVSRRGTRRAEVAAGVDG